MLIIVLQLAFLASHVQTVPDKGIRLSFVKDAHSFPIRDANPLGLSLEFSEFPSYMTEVKQTKQCIRNLETALKAPLAIRIGGTSQDFAIFDSKQVEPIRNEYAKTQRTPIKSTFGPQFIQLASTFSGPTTLGLNRRMDQLNNVAAATALAIKKIMNLDAIELGNEPEYYGSKAPIARGKPWNPEADAASQLEWQKSLSEKVNQRGFIQAGVYLSNDWTIQNLASKSAKNVEFIKSFGRHAYPQTVCRGAITNLTSLMMHSNIVKFVERYRKDVDAANKLGKPMHFSETNSATCEGGEMSKMFGASLWLIDYTFRSLILGVNRLYFHQATINYSRYNFWNREKVSAPYYGAYFSALALHGASHINILETSNPSVAAYVLYRCLKIIKVVVYNSDVYSGKPVKGPEKYHLADLPARITSARLLRLTASNALVTTTDTPEGPQIGKAQFTNTRCSLSAPLQYETPGISGGTLSFDMRASEAVLIDFNDGSIPTC